MNAKRLFAISLVLIIALSANIAFASGKYGPFHGTSPDSGTCGNNWANDNLNRFGTNVGPNGLTMNFSGSFSTVAGSSPGACDGHPDNGNKVANGVTGSFSGFFTVNVHNGSFDPNTVCTQATCNTTSGFVKTLYGPSATYDTNGPFKFIYTRCDGKQHWQNASTGNSGDITGSPVICQNKGQPETWFDPDDSRVDPRPSDRLAVYCNVTAKPPSVVVYGIAGSDQPDWNKGFWLATFANADLIKAGPSGLTKTTVQGTVSMMQDGNGHFYVAWNGGKYGANGQGVWAKSFSCSF